MAVAACKLAAEGSRVAPMEEGLEKRELEGEVVTKVVEVVSAIKNAKHVDQVIRALHSLVTLLFPFDSSLLSGSFTFALISIKLFTFFFTRNDHVLFYLFQRRF